MNSVDTEVALAQLAEHGASVDSVEVAGTWCSTILVRCEIMPEATARPAARREPTKRSVRRCAHRRDGLYGAAREKDALIAKYPHRRLGRRHRSICAHAATASSSRQQCQEHIVAKFQLLRFLEDRAWNAWCVQDGVNACAGDARLYRANCTYCGSSNNGC